MILISIVSLLIIFCVAQRFCFFHKNIKTENYIKNILRIILEYEEKKPLIGLLDKPVSQGIGCRMNGKNFEKSKKYLIPYKKIVNTV